MRKIRFAALLAPSMLYGQLLSPVWVELGPGSQAIARVVVNAGADCPALVVDGQSSRMSPRHPVPDGLRPACEAPLPAGTKSASVNGRALTLPTPDPSRIVVLGDTGCRIKGVRVQDCSDPAKWPFEIVAGHASAAGPQLVIHVGDYLYREDGRPSGDKWEAWNADFFEPAARLLAAAPWVFARGNHEDCDRSWRGWFYYLDPRPFTGLCQAYSKPYVVKSGSFEIAVIDTASANDAKLVEQQVDIFAAQLASLHVSHAWLVDHHPFWGMGIAFGQTAPRPLTAPLEAAWEKADPKGIDLVLSGHTHLFEVLSFDHGRPPQLVAGDGGTDLATAIPVSIKGMTIRGVTISSGETRHEFGFTLLNKSSTGWKLELKNPADVTRVTCGIEGARVACAN